ncbi:MAG: YfhO family protein [Anaerolineae bacterium]|nr:YfhO family protein [Anaerolineae bacterium]NUQ02689.1 YfhO family protein [Anaerolineae bacterium]
MRSSRIPWLILLAALALLFYRLFLGEAFYWGLPSLQFIPWRIEALDLLRAGQLPLWTSVNGAGAPLFANYQSSLLYPLNWLSLILPAAQTMSITVVLHLFIAGVGMGRFVQALGILRLGQGVAMLVFALSGYLVARAGTFPILQAAAWLPWLLWISTLLIERVTPRRIAWAAVFAALLLLAGHAQTAWYAMVMIGLYTLIAQMMQSPRRPYGALAVLGGVALGVGLAALQLLGTAELLAQSQRSGGVDFDFAMNLSYAPARLLNLLTPHIFGTPADGSYITGGAYFEDAVYIGLIPLFAALAAVGVWFARRRESDKPLALRLTPFWMGISLVGMVLAFGVHTPIFPFLFEHIPTFSAFQAPVRWHLWTVTGLSVLAAVGVSWWWRGWRVRRWSTRLAVAAGAAVFLAVPFVVFAPSSIPAVNLMARAVAYVGVMALAAAFLTLSQPSPEASNHRRWSVLVLLLTAADLVYASWGLNPTTSAVFYEARPRTVTGRVLWQRDALERARFEAFLRFDDYPALEEQRDAYRDSLLPNMNSLDDAAVFNNFDPLLPSHHQDYSDLLDAAPTDGLLRAAGIGAVIDADGLMNIAGDSPRAWLVRAACWHASEGELRSALVDPAWDAFEQVHFLGDAGCAEPAPFNGNVRIFRDDGNVVEIAVETDHDAWLVLADTNYPGWTATVNDRDAVIYRANLAFRAVQVQAGASLVHFDYQPEWLQPGALISTLSLVGLLLLFRLGVVERRR